MNHSENTQPPLAQETDEQALQEHLPLLKEEQLEEVTGGVGSRPGSPDVTNTSYKDYMKSMEHMLYNPRKRTASQAGLPDLQPNKLQKVAGLTKIIR